jgi:hypothetical protein
LDSLDERRCSLVFRENITKDIYVYLEEAEILQGFEFWPHMAIDIERPASASKNHEFVFRLPLSIDDRSKHEYVKEHSLTITNDNK